MLQLAAMTRSLAVFVAIIFAVASSLHAANAAVGLSAESHTHGFGLAGVLSSEMHSSGHHDPAGPPDHHPLAGLCIAISGATLPALSGIPVVEVGVDRGQAPSAMPQFVKVKVPDPPPR